MSLEGSFSKVRPALNWCGLLVGTMLLMVMEKLEKGVVCDDGDEGYGGEEVEDNKGERGLEGVV